MAQAHETGTSQVGGPKLAKVFYGRIFKNLFCKCVFSIHIYCKLGPLNGVTFIYLRLK